MDRNALQNIPDMNSILDHPLLAGLSRERVKEAARRVIDAIRAASAPAAVAAVFASASALASSSESASTSESALTSESTSASTSASTSTSAPMSLDAIAERVLAELHKNAVPHLRRVVNATGIILHTNLGRAPLGIDAHSFVSPVFDGYSNLEYDIESGERGKREAHIEKLIRELTGAEAAIAVNNNAAAVFLILAALARGKKVAVSRGELVEIGGSFRVPEIMAESGAELCEIGTTNKTRLSDYQTAIRGGCSALLKVHASNFQIVGFTESVSIAELAALGKSCGVPVIYDMGACFLLDPKLLGIQAGDTARDAIEAGADIICFSGDKLVGSAQSGIIAGKREYIDAIRRHPVARMVRPDKLTLSALEATLGLYRYPNEAIRRIPILSMLSASTEDLRGRAQSLAEKLRSTDCGIDFEARSVEDETGGGSLPNVPLHGWAVAALPRAISPNELAARLRHWETPIIARISDGALLLSMRTLLPGDEELIVEAFTTD